MHTELVDLCFMLSIILQLVLVFMDLHGGQLGYLEIRRPLQGYKPKCLCHVVDKNVFQYKCVSCCVIVLSFMYTYASLMRIVVGN